MVRLLQAAKGLGLKYWEELNDLLKLVLASSPYHKNK